MGKIPVMETWFVLSLIVWTVSEAVAAPQYSYGHR